jgi:hypothetical protein
MESVEVEGDGTGGLDGSLSYFGAYGDGDAECVGVWE